MLWIACHGVPAAVWNGDESGREVSVAGPSRNLPSTTAAAITATSHGFTPALSFSIESIEPLC